MLSPTVFELHFGVCRELLFLTVHLGRRNVNFDLALLSEQNVFQQVFCRQKLHGNVFSVSQNLACDVGRLSHRPPILVVYSPAIMKMIVNSYNKLT